MNAFSLLKSQPCYGGNTACLCRFYLFCLLNKHGPQKKDKVQTYMKLVHRISTETSELK